MIDENKEYLLFEISIHLLSRPLFPWRTSPCCMPRALYTFPKPRRLVSVSLSTVGHCDRVRSFKFLYLWSPSKWSIQLRRLPRLSRLKTTTFSHLLASPGDPNNLSDSPTLDCLLLKQELLIHPTVYSLVLKRPPLRPALVAPYR